MSSGPNNSDSRVRVCAGPCHLRTLNPRGVRSILLRRTYSDLPLYRFWAVISCPICPRAGSVLARVFSGPPGVAVNSCSDWPIPAWIGACTDVTQRKECRQEA